MALHGWLDVAFCKRVTSKSQQLQVSLQSRPACHAKCATNAYSTILRTSKREPLSRRVFATILCLSKNWEKQALSF